MHESPRTPCRYQLCVRIYACTTSTAFTLAPCWHQIRMHHINSLHFCAFASAFNNCKPNSSAKISKKRSKTFHLAVKGIQHTSRWLKLERQQQVQKLLWTPPAQAVDDPIQTAAGTLNKFCWIEGISKPRAMAGQLEITEATSWRLSTTSATDSGRQGDPASCRPTRTTAEGCLPSQNQGSLFFFLFVSRCGPEGHKNFSIVSSTTPSNGGNGLQHRSASSSSLQAWGEGTRRPGTGAPPKRSWRGPEEKWRPGETRARSTYTWSLEASVDRALHGERSWDRNRGTPHSWTIIEHVEQKTIWTWTWAHVAALTTGRILVHNLLRASTQVLHTYSRKWTWSWGEPWLLVRSHSLGIDDATWLAEIRASELWSMGHRLLLQRLPAAWNCSFIQYGKQVAGAAPAIIASYQQNCARAYTKSGCLLCASICVRNQDTGQRNSVPPTAPLNNQQNDPVVYLHFGELAQCLTCIASCQQSLSHGCVPARKHCRSAYLCCLPSTTGRGHVSARILGWTGAAPARTASSGQPSPAVYLHTY